MFWHCKKKRGGGALNVLIDRWGALQNKWVNGKEFIDAQICLQIIWMAQDGSAQICFGSISAQRLTSKVCFDLSRSGSLTGVRLFSGPRAPVLYLTRPNCVLCSSCWLSSLFDILRRKLLAWRVLSFLWFLSLTCQHTVKSLFGSNVISKCFAFGAYDDLIDRPNAAIGLIMFSRERKTERPVLSDKFAGVDLTILFFFFFQIGLLLIYCCL